MTFIRNVFFLYLLKLSAGKGYFLIILGSLSHQIHRDYLALAGQGKIAYFERRLLPRFQRHQAVCAVIPS